MVSQQSGVSMSRLWAGCYEVWVANKPFTISRDQADDGRWHWYCREGTFPGGPAFDLADTLDQAVQFCCGSE